LTGFILKQVKILHENALFLPNFSKIFWTVVIDFWIRRAVSHTHQGLTKREMLPYGAYLAQNSRL